jgi:hypothetical protein
MISKEEFLNGNWWLVIARYPVACDASINEVIESDEDPTLELSYANELSDECINSFGYLDSPDIDEDNEDQFEDWYEQKLEDIELEAIKIDEKVIDEYGIEWLNNYLA